MRAVYREEPCSTALNRVKGMGFAWSLNPYMGCAHRCAFCYVRGFERRADRPSDDRYGTNIRVKTNVVEVLRHELGRRSWRRETVAIGAATDPYQPAEGRYRLTRGCIQALGAARTPLDIITRGPLVVRDVDVLAEASQRAQVRVSVSIATLDEGDASDDPARCRLRLSEQGRASSDRRRGLLAVKQKLPRISLATVYKNLEALVKCGAISKLTYGDASARYDIRTDYHYHTRCLKCGKIWDLDAQEGSDC